MNTHPTPLDVERDVAVWLLQEHKAGKQFVRFAETKGVGTMATAYRVQREYVRLVAESRATRRAGYKIGLTSHSMQAMCGIDTPVAGVMLQDGMHATGVRLRPADYVRMGVEFEIAVRLGCDLAPMERPYSFEDVAAAVDAVAPAVEIVDDRHCDYGSLDVLSLVADNAWNAGAVIGEFVTSWPDLAEVEGRVILNGGEVLDSGSGRDVLGNPLQPVVWLANHLAASGESLCAGDVIMTGSMVTTKFPTHAQHLRFEIAGLGAVELQIVE